MLLRSVSWMIIGHSSSSLHLSRCALVVGASLFGQNRGIDASQRTRRTLTTQLYFIFYLLLVLRAYVYLRKRPFASHRMANMLEMLTWRQQLSTFIMVLLSQVLLGWVKHDDCSTRMISWAAGLFPINVWTWLDFAKRCSKQYKKNALYTRVFPDSTMHTVVAQRDYFASGGALHAHHPL